MIQKIKSIFDDILHSLHNGNEGYSAKKLTIFGVVTCVIAAHIKWITLGDFSLLTTILPIDYGFILTLFGINVYDKSKNKTDSTTV